ncbi:MAG TPA: AAA family ATPase [Candidatus Sumerlaeota bacterium]|nr:AAA family ATPase [Candidatus Sumerlaeota bacterium]
MNPEISAINEKVKDSSQFVDRLAAEVANTIVGQKYMVERLLIALLGNGHALLEGVPGLAKTLAVKTLASAIDAHFQRIQFTPDLLPADLLGTMIYNQKDGTFYARKGPLFANFILADEINRAPAKVQSALLEAMQERQITIGDQTFPLPEPFLVLATQNPIEQEGTYPLPEAQVDRFMLKLRITYPSRKEEFDILERMAGTPPPAPKVVITPGEILEARRIAGEIYMDEKIKNYILDIVFATRDPKTFGLDVGKYIQYGASPRATIFLAQAAKAYAFLRHRGHVIPDDVKAVGPDILRHRVILTYEAEAEEISSDQIIQAIFDKIEAP